MNVEDGLDYILDVICAHPVHRFPRTISTLSTQNRQVEVFDKQEVLQYFEESDYLDCRISAFGRHEIEKEIPNNIFVDLDDKNALDEVLALFHKKINGVPLVLNTGNGYCLVQPINMVSLAKTTITTDDDEIICDLPKKFLLFAERYLTNSKCDMGNHPSLKSCLIRVPGTYNSKLVNKGQYKESQVTITSEWNKIRADVRNLPFMSYIKKLEIHLKKKRINNFSNYPNEISYIEDILKTKLTSGRKRIFAMVLCPYMINIKKMSIAEAEIILSDYFEGYIPKQLILYKLNEVFKKGILPYSLAKMRENDPELYHIVTSTGTLKHV